MDNCFAKIMGDMHLPFTLFNLLDSLILLSTPLVNRQFICFIIIFLKPEFLSVVILIFWNSHFFLRFYIVGFSTLFAGLLFALFPKENIVAKPKGCFPTSVDDMPRKPFGVDYCVLLWGIGTEHLLARNHQMPIILLIAGW